MSTVAVIDRIAAVNELAGHMADRDKFVIITSIDVTMVFADRLAAIGPWTSYLDNGTNKIVRTSHMPALATAWNTMWANGGACVAVFTVPKTVPAAKLSTAVGHDVPADGSQDILIVQAEGCQLEWPILFVDAIGQVDPKAAATIRASDFRNLS